MEYKKSEIEKLVIHLTDNDNVINTFPLERQEQGDYIIWKFQDEQFNIEIITDKEIRTIKQITGSDTIAESNEEIRHKFSDAEEEEGNEGVKYNPIILAGHSLLWIAGSVYSFVSLPFHLIPEAGCGQNPRALINTGFLDISGE